MNALVSMMIRFAVAILIISSVGMTFTKNGNLLIAKINKEKFATIMGWTLFISSVGFVIYFVAWYRVYPYLLQSNLCTLTYWTLSISLILKKDKFINPLIIPALVGALMYFFLAGDVYADSPLEGMLVIWRHALLLFIATYWVRVSHTFEQKDWYGTLWYILGVYTYISIVSIIAFYASGQDARWGVYSMGVLPASYQPVIASFGFGDANELLAKGWIIPAENGIKIYGLEGTYEVVNKHVYVESGFSFLGTLEKNMPFPIPSFLMVGGGLLFGWGASFGYRKISNVSTKLYENVAVVTSSQE